MRHILASFCLAFALGACSSGPSSLGLGGGDINYALGSILGAELPARDASALAPIFVQAVARGGEGERFDWKGPDSFGWVTPGARVLGNLKPDYEPQPAYPAGLYLDDPMETELGLFALKSNSNVRLGPSTDYPVLVQLPSGDGVIGVGRVIGKPWVLAEQNGRIVGYIHESLMIKAPGTELELAGGPTRRGLECREFEQRISYTGRSDRWNGVACLRDGNWELQKPPENAPVQLF
jgi:uncharacterized protein YraI